MRRSWHRAGWAGGAAPASPEHWGLHLYIWNLLQGKHRVVDLPSAITAQVCVWAATSIPAPSHCPSHCTGSPTALAAAAATKQQLWEKGVGKQTCLPLLCGLSDLQDGRRWKLQLCPSAEHLLVILSTLTSRGCSHPAHTPRT